MHIRLLICDGCQRPMRLHLTPGERLPAIAAKIGWYVGGSTTLCPDCFKNESSGCTGQCGQ